MRRPKGYYVPVDLVINRGWVKQLRRFRFQGRILIIILLIIAALILAATTSMSRGGLSLVEKILRESASPLQSSTLTLSEKIALLPKYFSAVNDLVEENEQLKEEVGNLQSENTYMTEVAQENKRLRELLDMAETVQDWQPKGAKVIARSSESWYKTITIDGGSDDGFAVGMPVISGDGLVGRIWQVTNNTAEVLLITDSESAVAAVAQITRDAGIVEGGGGNTLLMVHIPAESKIVKGQIVVSSGLGSFYPHGLRIGTIGEIKKSNGGLTLQAEIIPFVDFNEIEDVLVLVNAEVETDATSQENNEQTNTDQSSDNTTDSGEESTNEASD